MTKRQKNVLKIGLYTTGVLAFLYFSDYLKEIPWLNWIIDKALFLILIVWFIILIWAGIAGSGE